MSDVLVQEKVCGACGVEVRADTQFCYNCGESLEEDAPIAAPEGGIEPAVIPSITSKDGAADVSERNGDNTSSADAPDSPMQSAASLRRRSRTATRKPVEVVWEPAGGTNITLIAATVLLVLFAGVMVILALYYR